METLILNAEQLTRITNKYAEHQSTMQIMDCKELSFVTDISWLNDLVDPTTFVAANFYKHTIPMSPHVDQFDPNIRTVLFIPIEAEGNNQSLVVFDQTYTVPANTPGCVWYPTADELEPENTFYKRYASRPCDTPGVQGCTAVPCPPTLLESIEGDPNFVHGLTGQTWSYTPGTAIALDATRIHCTGKTNGLQKAGLALWFSGTLSEVATYWRT